MASTYVLDTSVILSEGLRALFSFKEDEVVLPLIVIRELQAKRHDPILGQTAREVLKFILRSMKEGLITEGVSLGEGYGTLRIEMNHVDTPLVSEYGNNVRSNDLRILAVAKYLKATLVTRDIELQILANIEEVPTETLYNEGNEAADKYLRGLIDLEITTDELDEIHKTGSVKLNHDIPVNTGVRLLNYKGSALAVAGPAWTFYKVDATPIGSHVGRTSPQKILFYHLMNKRQGVVSVSGPAGSGKSFAMLTAAMELLKNKDNGYEKIVVIRPINPAGGQHQDMGYLPGTAEEKMDPHTQAVWDTLGTAYGTSEAGRIKRQGIIEFAPIAYIRGRTLANCIVVMDEMQNLEQDTIATLLSRLGVNARAFVGWDIAQRDAQYIGKYDGIYRVAKKLHGHPLFAHVALEKSERSPISDMVAKLLGE